MIYFVDTYYNNKLNKKFITAGRRNKCKSYDFNKNKIYYVYMNKNLNSDEEDRDYTEYHSLIVNNKDGLTTLLGGDRHINMWNFHTGELLHKIDYENYDIPGLCLWNNDYLFVGADFIKIIDLNEKKCIKEINEENQEVNCIRIINLPKIDQCFLTRGMGRNKNKTIKIWIPKMNQ